MGDRIAVMSLGVLQQLDTPQRLYDMPANKFVAGFIGSPSMNFIDVTIERQGEHLYAVSEGLNLRVPDTKGAMLAQYVGQPVILGVRPEHIIDWDHANGVAPSDSRIPVTVDVVELLGNEIFVYLIMENGHIITARMDPDTGLQRGMKLDVTASPDKLHFFDPQTEYGVYY